MVRRFLRQSKIGKSPGKSGNRHLDLLPREGRTDTEVNATPEPDVCRIATTNVESIGVGKTTRVALRTSGDWLNMTR